MSNRSTMASWPTTRLATSWTIDSVSDESASRSACDVTRYPSSLDPLAPVFIAEDPDRAWSELGPYLLHDARMYAEWLGTAESASLSKAATIDSLRAEQGASRIYTPDEAIAAVRSQGILMLHPLCGGLPPELAFQTLELLGSKVLPGLSGSSES